MTAQLSQLSSCLSWDGDACCIMPSASPLPGTTLLCYAVPSCLLICPNYHLFTPVQVGRYSSFYVVNNLVPIILSTCLGFFVFLLDGDDMEKRLSEYPAPKPTLSSRSMCAASAMAYPLCYGHAVIWTCGSGTSMFTLGIFLLLAVTTTCLLPWCAALLVTLFLALTALQFVISTNLPNSR